MKITLRIACLFLGLSLMACGSKKSDEPGNEPLQEDAYSEADDDMSSEAESVDDETVPEAASGIEGEATSADVATTEAAVGTTYLENGKTIYLRAEEEPQYVGGEPAMQKYLSKNLQYPVDATEEGTVFVEFVVADNGVIESAKVLKGPEDPALRNEAVKAVSSMPAWTPGRQGGKAVHAKYILPITFRKL